MHEAAKLAVGLVGPEAARESQDAGLNAPRR
jgi:hypothetical protein